MSNQEQATLNYLAWVSDLIDSQMRRGLTTGRVLNINAMDELDPVHYRASQHPEREFDHDGDLGREHDDHMRDNGHGGRGGSLDTFVQIADALPVIEAPSIVAGLPATVPVDEQTAADRKG